MAQYFINSSIASTVREKPLHNRYNVWKWRERTLYQPNTFDLVNLVFSEAHAEIQRANMTSAPTSADASKAHIIIMFI